MSLLGSGIAAASAHASDAAPAAAPPGVQVVAFTPPDPVPPELISAASQAAGLVEDNPAAYAGSYYDSASGKVILEATGAASQVKSQPAVLTANPSIVVRTAPWSRADAESKFESLLVTAKLTDRVTSWWVDPAIGGFQVMFIGQPSSADLAAFAGALGPVTVIAGMTDGGKTTDAQNDGTPIAGGSRYFTGFSGPPPLIATLHERCSAGFGYKIGGTDYMLTAGHCFWRGTQYDELWRVSGPNNNPTPEAAMGDFGDKSTWGHNTGTVNTGSDNAAHGDLSLVNLSAENKSAGDSIWVSDTDKRNVTSREAPAVGDPVCRAGTTDFQVCGFTINAVNTMHTYADGTTVRAGDLAALAAHSACAQAGDSGGPVYRRVGDTDATAVGIISGTFVVGGFGCDLVFTGAEEAIQAWGGGLNLH
ncbi:MAG TPA: S1 family peptidase [Nocardioides sp.]|jgi:hypothetical protein|nr:S1 family peptidase [Nocardioides sp.]